MCRALSSSCKLSELDLSWNASGRATALALEAALRGNPELCAAADGGADQKRSTRDDEDARSSSDDDASDQKKLSPLRLHVLRLRNNGLTDPDGAVIIDALTARSSWQLVDLSDNLLEGGAALCVRAVVAAMTAADAGWSSSSGSSSSNSSTSRSSSSSDSSSSDDDDDMPRHAQAWLPDGVKAQRVLLLDRNPLGASGAVCVLRSLAGCHALAETAASSSSLAATREAAPTNQTSRSSSKGSWNTQEATQRKPSPLSLHVSIHGCSLVAGDKGFRLGMSDNTPALQIAPQVATLLDAVQPPAASASAAAPGRVASSKRGGPSSSDKEKKKKAGGASKSPAAKAASRPSTAAVLIVTERAAGLNLNSPAGKYNLDLSHPATQQMILELLDLRSRLSTFQQQQEAAAQVAGAAAAAVAVRRRTTTTQEAAPAAVGDSSLLGGFPGRRHTTRDYVTALVRRASRSEAVDAAAVLASRRASQGDGAAAAAAAAAAGRPASTLASRRQTVGDGLSVNSSGNGAGMHRSSALAARALVQRFKAPLIDALAFVEIQLDGGKPLKMEKLLELQPWVAARKVRRQQQQAAVPEMVNTATKSTTAAAPLAAPAPTAGPAGTKKQKSKGPHVYRRLSFAVKIAAVVSAEEPRVLPEQLLQWAVKVLRQPKTDDKWRLRLVELLLPDWLLTPLQARELLDCFDPDMGQEQRLTAAQLAYARLAQPLDFWPSVLPSVLKPLQQSEFEHLAAPWLTAVDRSNLTGRYVLNLGRPLDQAVAQRLQLAALQEGAWRDNKYFVGWRNATLNGRLLKEESLSKLQVSRVALVSDEQWLLCGVFCFTCNPSAQQ